jgi:hypothetical protein
MHTIAETIPRASWEDPVLPFRERFRRHGRRMAARLLGPAGSLTFHLLLVGALVLMAVAPEPLTDGGAGYDIVPLPPEAGPLDPPAAVPTTPGTGTPSALDPLAGLPAAALPGTAAAGPDASGDAASVVAPGLDPAPVPAPFFEGPFNPRLSLSVGGFIDATERTPEGITNAIRRWWPSAGPGGRRTPGGGLPAGADPGIDTAVVRALRWLQSQQLPDGSWPGTAKSAMTALAVLALLGHGEKPDKQPFGPVTRRGIEWLLNDQEESGRFKSRDSNDYTQPIAAYALAEAYAMTQHPVAKKAAEKALALVVRGQHPTGGFNYNLDQTERDDTSYMAWCAQAMKAGRLAKLDVPGLEAAMRRAVVGFKLNAHPEGGFGYVSPGRTGLSGAGALSLQMLGAGGAREVRDTLAFLEPVTFRFDRWAQQPYGGASPLYYWYYVTQTKFQDGARAFDSWNRTFAPELVARQKTEQIAGPDGATIDAGHWESPSPSEHHGGVVQDTALCTLMLEVYYRYLPSYQRGEPVEDLATAR